MNSFNPSVTLRQQNPTLCMFITCDDIYICIIPEKKRLTSDDFNSKFNVKILLSDEDR